MSEQVAEVEEQETGDTPAETEPETEPETVPDEPETEPEEEPEAEAEPEAAPAVHTEQWWEKAWTASSKEDERHAARVQAIFEEEAQEFAQCPMCLAGPAGWLVATEFSDDQRSLINAALGVADPSEFEPMEGAALCTKCRGLGKVRTPSLVPEEQVKPCMDCNGLGWKHVVGPPPVYAPSAVPAGTENGTTGTEPEATWPDAWGRAVGHPHYGLNPAEIGV